MLGSAKAFLSAILLLSVSATFAHAAEREDVRKVINLVTSVKMPYPESLSRNRAKTERVWLDREGAMTGCTLRRPAIARKCCEFATNLRAASTSMHCIITWSISILMV